MTLRSEHPAPWTRKGWVRGLPDLLTFLRLTLLPAWFWLAERLQEAELQGGQTGALRGWCVALLAVIALTDALDGVVARAVGTAGRAGAIRDAVADRAVQAAVLLYLALRSGPAFPPVPLWFAALVVGRDALLVLIRWVLTRTRGQVPAEHRLPAKAGTVLVFAVLLWTVIGLPEAGVVVGTWLATAVLTIALVHYAFVWSREAGRVDERG